MTDAAISQPSPAKSRRGRYISPRIRQKQELAEIERQALRSKCARKVLVIIEAVAHHRKVPWEQIYAEGRGSNAASSARVLAMGLCCALEVPQYMVARSFRRNWATVYAAERRCSKLFRDSVKFRSEWNALFKTLETS